MRVHETALKHGVSAEDAVQAASWPIWVEELDDDSPARQLRLGFDTQGRLLETDQGDDRAATILLKAVLATGEEPQQARRALVQMSRDQGRIDMAGRWGIAIGGLTARDEQRAFAAGVLAKGGTEAALRELSLMRFDES